MVGGEVIGLFRSEEDTMLYVRDSDPFGGKSKVCVIERRRDNDDPVQVAVGDSVWWQGEWVMWTPKAVKDAGIDTTTGCGETWDIQLPRNSYTRDERKKARKPYNLTPKSPEPDCPACGNTMARRWDTFGEYFACFRFTRCNQRLPGQPYDGYYKKAFNTRGEDGIWRHKAHLIFDRLWKEKGLSRSDSYRVLQKIMGLDEKAAHISKFSVQQCKTLIRRLEDLGDAALILSPRLPTELQADAVPVE